MTSNFMIGSRIAIPALWAADLKAMDPATLNAISDESTSWYEPSVRTILMSVTG